MATYVANEQIRLDVFLAKETGASRSNIKTVVESDGVFVNGVLRKKSARLSTRNNTLQQYSSTVLVSQ